MRVVLLILSSLLLITVGYGQSTDWTYPGNSYSDGSGTGGLDSWEGDYTYLTEGGGTYECIDYSNGSAGTWYTPILKTYSYGFSLPTGAEITGIECQINKTGIGAATWYDYEVKLYVGGVQVGDNKAITSTPYSGEVTDTYGGPSDLWGLTPTKTQIEASNFGVGIKCKAVAVEYDYGVIIDFIRLKIYYSVPSGSSPFFGVPF